jgi:hypothetical protein
MQHIKKILLPAGLLAATLSLSGLGSTQPQVPQHPQSVWIEAENLAPLQGANFSFFTEDRQTKGSWSLSGPGVAAEWTQGGESDFLSIATRADEPAGTAVGRDIEVPVAGAYSLWVRYADYLNQKEEFGVRITQNGKTFEHVFGSTPVIDELDPLKLRWGWAFGWQSTPVSLQEGAAHLELYSTGPTQARRQVDALCLTTDTSYHPTGREKPDFAAWTTLRALRNAPNLELPLATKTDVPAAWTIGEATPSFLWNVRGAWLDGLTKPAAERIEAPYNVDSPLQADFLKMFAGKTPPIYGNPLSGPAIYISDYPGALADGSPFLAWMERHPQSSFAILLNYGEPKWPKDATDADKQKVYANLLKFKDRFRGFVAGESISYAYPDQKTLDERVRAAKSRAEVLAILREMYTGATVQKFSGYYGRKISAAEAWAPVIPCLSANIETFAHALGAWGVRRIGHENSANAPALSHTLAFLRGAARQFGAGVVDYQSANLGDASMTLARQDLFYPASSRYVLDNQYDIWSGGGVNWVLKDYLLNYLSGTRDFYHEEGHDIFWKPGGGAAGDNFPVQLSPRGQVDLAVQRLVGEHPRGPQYTPVAFLLDEAHGWSQERYQPGGFGLDPALNPKVLAPGAHEASIRGWLDVAYYPAPETQNEPATAIRQTFVNGVFGDIFDVIVTAPGKTQIASTYPVLIAAGEVPLSAEWGNALKAYVQNGGTLVAAADQFSGAGAGVLGLQFGKEAEASAFTWTPGGEKVASNVFRYKTLAAGKDRVLAATADGAPLCVERKLGKGRLISIAMPLGLGVNERPTPLSGLVMEYVTRGLMPMQVQGDVEWTLNKLGDGGWLVSLFNNRGVNKPQHGINPTDYKQAQNVTIRVPFAVKSSDEWVTQAAQPWQKATPGASTQITVPAGGVRMIEVHPG